MNMKNIFSIVALMSLPILAFAQTQLTATTTSAAMTSGQNYVALTSVTGVGDKSQLLIQDPGGSLPELVTVRGACVGTQCTVVRQGQKITAHISGAMVLISPAYANNTAFGQWVQAKDPAGAAPYAAGTSSCANTIYTPWVNYVTGAQWFCSTLTGSWVPGWGSSNPSSSQPISGTATASAAGATAIASPLVHISGTNAITSFAMSAGWNWQGFCVIPDGAFTTTATNNIIKASTAVANKTLCFTYDAKQSGFTPDY